MQLIHNGNLILLFPQQQIRQVTNESSKTVDKVEYNLNGTSCISQDQSQK